MFYYWSGVLIAYIIELNKFLRGTKRKICFAHYRCISRQNNGGNFLCGKKGHKGGGCPRVFYFFDAILSFLNISSTQFLVFWISPSVPTLQTPAQVLSGGWRTEILTLCTVGFHNSYFGKTSLESARLKSQYHIIWDFTQNRRQQQILSKTHKYFLFDFFATNADYFSFSQTQTKEILTSFDVFGLREASA